VDDCSDEMQAVLQERVSTMADRVIYHPTNRGKEAALRSGFTVASGDIILVQDAELEYSPKITLRFWRHLYQIRQTLFLDPAS